MSWLAIFLFTILVVSGAQGFPQLEIFRFVENTLTAAKQRRIDMNLLSEIIDDHTAENERILEGIMEKAKGINISECNRIADKLDTIFFNPIANLDECLAEQKTSMNAKSQQFFGNFLAAENADLSSAFMEFMRQIAGDLPIDLIYCGAINGIFDFDTKCSAVLDQVKTCVDEKIKDKTF